MSKWQLIKTAPITSLYGGEEKTLLLWVADALNGRGDIALGVVYDFPSGPKASARGYHGDWRVTHWMPLPEPPA